MRAAIESQNSIPPLITVNDCWNRIGVNGDRSCAELPQHIHCRNCPVFAAAAQTLFERPAPAGYLAEWTTALGQALPSSECDFVSVVVVRLSDEWLALAAAFLVEVTLPRSIHCVPHRTNRVFRGMVNVRGQLHLCVSLHGVLNIEAPAADARGLLVVVDYQGERWAFLVDEVLGVDRIPRRLLRKVPGTLANPVSGVSQAVFTWRERHVGFLDELRLIAAFRSLGQ